jgi:hypothetical protein
MIGAQPADFFRLYLSLWLQMKMYLLREYLREYIRASASFRRYRGASTLIIPIQIINRLHADCLTYGETARKFTSAARSEDSHIQKNDHSREDSRACSWASVAFSAWKSRSVRFVPGHLRVAPAASPGRRQFSDSSIESIAVTF